MATIEEAKAELKRREAIAELERRGLSSAQPNISDTSQGESPNSFAMGLMDMVHGGNQLMSRISSPIQEQVLSVGGLFPNRLSKQAGQMPQIFDKIAQDAEQKYQAQRQAAGETGIDWGRIGGNIANPINFIGGAGLPATVARGAAIGLMQPSSDTENFWQDKALQGTVGAASAYGGKVVGDKITGEVSKRGKQVAQLLKEKVPVTMGQRIGGIANRVEEKLTSVPLLGDLISSARGRSSDAINRAAYARALSPVDEVMPDDIPMGRDSIKFINEKLSDKYDDLLPKLSGIADDQFFDDLASLKSLVQADDIINPAERQKFANILQNTVENKFSKAGGVTGKSLKSIENDLGAKARALQSGDVSERQLADALMEAQATVRKMVERSNPDYAKELKNINTGYANFKRIQAASKSGSEGGVFTPRQLNMAVRQLDKTKDKGAYARGDALMQDLSDAAASVVSNRVPNSGTVDRGLLFGLGAAGLGGYGQTEAPGSDWATYAAMGLAPGLLYTRPGVAATNAIGNVGGSIMRSVPVQGFGKTLPYVSPQLFAPMMRK